MLLPPGVSVCTAPFPSASAELWHYTNRHFVIVVVEFEFEFIEPFAFKFKITVHNQQSH